jgi:act minimal PKS chain-length factor (CLF/KS beta)
VANVVVTGIGVVAPTGVGVDEYWERTLLGGHGLRPLAMKQRRYQSALAGQISDFESSRWINSRLMVQTDISTRYALAAAQMAVEDCGGVDGLSDFDQGVVTSNATGGFEFTHREFAKLWQEGPSAVSVYESFAWFYAVNTGQISIRHGMRGPGTVIVTEQAGGIDALGSARQLIKGGTKLILGGGVDSSLDPWGWVSHMASGRLSRSERPESAYLPFDRRADGYVPGEGGAILVLEDESSAINRSAAHRYGRIAGHASTFDRIDSQGGPEGLARAIRLALDDAALSPTDVDAVFADGAGVADLDASEAAALAAVFGIKSPPVTAPKSGTGRLYAGGGPLDVATALLSIRDQILPPTPFTTETRAEYSLDLVVGKSRPCPLDVIVVAARGRLGFNSALVVTSAC